MKTSILMFVAVIIVSLNGFSQGVSINNTNDPPHASAMLHISSDTSGVLIPAMTSALRNDINNPATGLLIYQTDNTPGFYYYNGSSWELIGSGAFAIDDLYDGKTTGYSIYFGTDAGSTDDGSNNSNVAIGHEAMKTTIAGDKNAAFGYQALMFDTTGSKNTAIGYRALKFNISGNNNTAIGFNANLYNREGSTNTIIGSEAGRGSTLHDKSGNVYIGYQAGYNDTTDNKLYIENSNADSANALIYGNFSDDLLALNARVGIGTQSPHISAALEIDSDTEGFLPSRLTNVQRDAISSPVAGLFIFNTDEELFQYYDGAAWQSLNLEPCVPAQPGTITGDEYPDCNETGVSYSIGAVASATYYNWTVPSGATLASGQGTTSITVDFGTTGGDVSVRAENGCGNSNYTDMTVTIGTPPNPDTIYGNAYPECNETGVVYSVDAIGGADNYTWSVPATATLQSGQGTTSISVDFGTAGGDVQVRAENNCGNSAYKSLVISIGIPSQPGSITGEEYPDCNSSESYSIDAVEGATNYTWTVPTGASISSGQGTTSISVSFGTLSGNVSVRAENSCGNSAYTDLAVTIGSPAQPGTISGENVVCPNETGVMYIIDAVPGTDYYVWTVPPGATYTQSTTRIWVDFGTQGGDITVYAVNNCGVGVERIKSVGISFDLGCPFQGGLMFYQDDNPPGGSSTDTVWLVSTEADQGQTEWGCLGLDIDDAEWTDVLWGDTNTYYILQECAQNNIAARICDELSLNGYDDWFLPSVDEMDYMYLNLYLSGLGDFIDGHGAKYWTSTQADGEGAYNYSFSAGGYDTYAKNYPYNLVRCVRKIKYGENYP
jgi:hypothetical protein